MTIISIILTAKTKDTKISRVFYQLKLHKRKNYHSVIPAKAGIHSAGGGLNRSLAISK
jgi:hypothetical protein